MSKISSGRWSPSAGQSTSFNPPERVASAARSSVASCQKKASATPRRKHSAFHEAMILPFSIASAAMSPAHSSFYRPAKHQPFRPSINGQPRWMMQA